MKNGVLALLFIVSGMTSFAQDSIGVSFSQEQDTISNQRFIDRYENVFMTKVPTRNLFKTGYTASNYKGSGFNFAYEYKLLPEFSLELGLYVQISHFNNGLIRWRNNGVRLWGYGKARWYYTMKNRIARGLSANNFSGSYFALSYDRALETIGYFQSILGNREKIGLQYGFQSRFLNNGHLDLTVGIFNRELWGSTYYSEPPRFLNARDFVLATQSTLGIAFGDWKKSAKAPVCDVLLCDEHLHDQWKLQLPDLTVGLRVQTANIKLAYERKIAKSAFSVEANVLGYYSGRALPSLNEAAFPSTYEMSMQGGAGVQLRYYFLQKHQIKRGKSGDNFSGPYAGIGAAYDFYRNRGYRYQGYQISIFHVGKATLSLGYQQRLFKRLYVDASLSYSRGKELKPDSKPFGNLNGRTSIGFTF